MLLDYCLLGDINFVYSGPHTDVEKSRIPEGYKGTEELLLFWERIFGIIAAEVPRGSCRLSVHTGV